MTAKLSPDDKGDKGLAMPTHTLRLEEHPGFGNRPYYHANCSCGWAAGGYDNAALRASHAKHIEEARVRAAAKVALERARDVAPELLEALIATLTALEKLDAGDTKVAKRARAVLYKATGGQP